MGSVPHRRDRPSGRKAREFLSRNLIGKRFPPRSDIVPVLAVAVFVCYTWTLFRFFDQLSSFLLYFTLGEIADILAYMMAFALLESLAVTGILLLFSAVLPSGWLQEGFPVKSFVILLILTATAILFQKSLTDDFPPTWMLLAFSLGPLALIVALLLLLRGRPKVNDILLNIQDRMLILLFIYVPIGLLSLLVVIYRNLL